MTKNNQKSSIYPPKITVPKGGGAIRGMGESFETQQFTGTGQFSIDLPFSAARGFHPKLTLSYNSGGGNGPFGLGCSLGISSITRKTDTGIPKYSGQDTFILSSNEYLVEKLGDDGQSIKREETKEGVTWRIKSYFSRFEGPFSKIEHWVHNQGNSYWILVTKNNVTSIYGQSSNARIVNPNNPNQIFEWLLETTFDAKGNKIQYQYKEEDQVNVPNTIYEKGHYFKANKYIQSVQYGNYVNQEGKQQFAYHLVFDYGEYDLENLNKPHSTPYIPTKNWGARMDPFSFFRSGFEIRTYRLCQNILLFHYFEQELGKNPILAKRLKLTYNQNKTLTTLGSIQEIGYRKKEDDSYYWEKLPALELTYASFDIPDEVEFKQLEISEDGPIPGLLDGSQFSILDLHGEGIPGIFYHNSQALYYASPFGEGTYQSLNQLDPEPISEDLNLGNVQLLDLNANGINELVVNTLHKAGYYKLNHNNKWENFEPFEQFPIIAKSPGLERTDLNGDGRTDLLLASRDNLLVYNSKGIKGYENGELLLRKQNFPLLKDESKKQLITFANIFGDGLSHRVSIQNGLIECWPSYGYGQFGNKITLGNAPLIENFFDVQRILLGDIDGSGTTDFIYVYPDKVEIYFNQSGNCFSSPLSLVLPEGYEKIDQIQFADIYGNGTECLVFSKLHPTGSTKHYYYDFISSSDFEALDEKVKIKPYLLIKTDNNRGVKHLIQYSSSTKFYLQDKKEGRNWRTRLPFPVQVVEKVSKIDALSQTLSTTEYRYHDGYYDEVEREFRGFGFVESWIKEKFAKFNQNNSPYYALKDLNKALEIPTTYTKTWHYVGAYLEQANLLAQFSTEYFKGDSQSYPFPNSLFAPSIWEADEETTRQAYIALNGHLIHKEIYWLDQEKQAKNPYTVESRNYKVRLLQARANQKWAAFLVVPQENIQYNYERNPQDPRVVQEFFLNIDEYGNIKRSCKVALARRKTTPQLTPIQPAQTNLKVTLDNSCFINKSQKDCYWISVPCQEKSFEILNFTAQQNGYVNFDYVDKKIKGALAHTIEFGSSSTTLAARLYSWKKTFFWNESLNNPLGLCDITKLGLIHHHEKAAFPEKYINDVFENVLSKDVIYKDGGFFFDASTGYWWDKGLVEFYHTTANTFYQPQETNNYYAQTANPAQSDYLLTRTTVAYDKPYYLNPVQTTNYLEDKLSFSQTALIDYQSGLPKQIVDENENVHQWLIDPLGKVIATTLWGSESDKPSVGGMLIYPYKSQKAQYQQRFTNATGGEITFDDVITNSEYYLQGASNFYFYNWLAWEKNKQPQSNIQLIRDQFYQEFPTNKVHQLIINYLDGNGKELVKKQRVKKNVIKENIFGQTNTNISAVQTLWLASDRTVYHSFGKAAQHYLPYISLTSSYQSQENIITDNKALAPAISIYDPLQRQIISYSSKGFISKSLFRSWEELTYDENDTVLESPFYNEFIKKYPSNPTHAEEDEKDALEKAVKCYNTPTTKVLDVLGRPFLKVENNLGKVSKDLFEKIVKAPMTSQEVWDALFAKGYLDKGGRITSKFQPYNKGFKLEMPSKYTSILPQLLEILKQNCLTSYSVLDIQGRVTKLIDPRLYYTNITDNKNYFNFKYKFPMSGKQPLRTDSADAGTNKVFHNIFNKLLQSWNARGYNIQTVFDRFQRPIEVVANQLDGKNKIVSSKTVERIFYGETQSNGHTNNLNGEIYKHYDPAGLSSFPSYSITKMPLTQELQVLAEYQKIPDWKTNFSSLLDREIFSTQVKYDALKRPSVEILPDKTTKVYTNYNELGLIASSKLDTSDAGEQSIIKQILYNELKEKAQISQGNGVVINNYYEGTTKRLLGIISQRPSTSTKPVQDQTYAYDPVGNVTRARNNALKTIFCNNQKVDTLSTYVYDPIYRLKSATGRQHPGILANTHINGFKQSIYAPFCPPPGQNDSNKLENYQELYTYDDSNNLVNNQHKAVSATWTRKNQIADDSNRLSNLPYDKAGNLLQLNINSRVK